MYDKKSANLNFIHCVTPGDHTGIAPTLFGLMFFVFMFFFVNIISAEAQSAANADSTVKRFPPVRVTADRIISNSAVDYSPYSIISREQFEESSSLQISDVLETVPGVFIKNYGGAGGMKTISMRGTSAQQTIVMIDGMRINSNQNGIVDLSTLPMSFIDDIEIVRGGNAAFFGGNSVGGAVNIRTDINHKSGKINASAKYGSYGETGIAVFASKPFENFSAAISCDYISSDGNYEFERSDAGTIGSFARTNADFSNFSLSAFVDTEFDDWSCKARIISSISERGIPGAVTEGNIENSESRLDEKDLILLVSGMKVFDSGNSLHIGILSKFNTFGYSDPNAYGADFDGIDNDYFNRDIQATIRFTGVVGKFLYNINSETSFADLRGDMLQPGVGDYVSRNSGALSGRCEASFDLTSSTRITGEAGLRLDAVSGNGSALSPIIGMIISFDSAAVKFISQLSSHYRPPNFNEMYYLNYGSTELRPERALSGNTGIIWTVSQSINIDAQAFATSTNDRIVAVPQSPVQWSAANIDKVLTRGIELAINGSFFANKLRASFSYTYQNSTNETEGSVLQGSNIPYIPEELISGTVVWNYKEHSSLGASFLRQSYMYSLPGNTLESVIPSSIRMNAFIRHSFKLGDKTIGVKLECINIFDQQYEIVRNYPMPGRIVRFAIYFKL